MAIQPYEAYEMARLLMQRVGIIHDLCNHAAYYLMDIDPKTVTWNSVTEEYEGSQLQVEGHDATISNIKQLANQSYQASLGYYNNIKTFIDNYPTNSEINDALGLWGTTGVEMKSLMDTVFTAFVTAKNATIGASTKAELFMIGENLLSAVPKMVLVRDFI